MIRAIWEFRVHPDHVAEFNLNYAPEGSWAKLFERSPAYHGTQLLHDLEDPLRYVTIDKWDDVAQYKDIREETGYALLDIACEKLTTSERLIGIFED
jgi:quinol monooxygenase YgiN